MADFKSFGLEIAQEAAELMRKNFRYGMAKEYKGDGSPVTETDLAINRMLIKRVQASFPGHAVVAEEENFSVDGAEFVWVCDPVDGTIPFSHGIPIATFSLALVHHGHPVLGIAVNPFQNEVFVAEPGKGATVNGKPLRVSSRDTLISSVALTGYWQQAEYNALPLIEALEKVNCNVLMLKSSVYGCSLVARGEAVGYVFNGRSAWDMAAMALIVEEAGGKVTDMHGNTQRYDQPIDGCVLSNGRVHDELLSMIRQTVKEQ